MKLITRTLIVAALCVPTLIFAQEDPVIKKIQNEENSNSQLKVLAHELLDVVGPRLVGTPQMKNAHDWAVAKYKSWDIPAENQQWGTWRGWERGVSHIDLVSPRVQTLEGRQLAWSPSTGKKAVTAEVVLLPEATDSIAFKNAISAVKGKFVLVSMKQPTGRPDDNWEKWATPESFEKMKKNRDSLQEIWDTKIKNTGYTSRTLPVALEKA